MEALLEFTIRLTESDIAGAQDQLWFRWSSLLWPGVIAAAAGLAWKLAGTDLSAVPTAGIAVGVLLIYLGTFGRWIFRMAVKRDFRRNPAAQAPTHYTFFEDRFNAISATGHSELRWQGLRRAKVSRDYVGLYLSPKIVFLIPLKQLTSGQTEELIKWVWLLWNDGSGSAA